MSLLEISIQSRVIIGISAMVLLFSSFLISFISSQRKKLQYHKDLQVIQENQKKALVEQNELLEQRVAERTSELSQQKEALQQALEELKASQLLLLQKEKMASLGEITAGVAHEIQNPLNFVNNFAEVNEELLKGLEETLAAEKLTENGKQEILPLLRDMAENLNKIHQHGKRADNIVKNMLQHSRIQSGTIESTDLNALINEYIKLAYQGYRSKNKLFNAQINCEFDETIESVSIVPADIGRALLNLINNSFYSLHAKHHLSGNDYHPTLLIKTKKDGNRIYLTVYDNGLGIPQKIIDKVFHPFFTTKPTGEGTGLGLSICYDIIKAHQGNLSVRSTEGEFAEFSIELNG